ncbi:MAG TPA: hypothetical protein DDX39_01745 [Bacteroidales bacterium]|nr:MAG: hypothetical protein A2W98_07960 [Bacteroidetes bacterium GWF2_33_38]OFY88338.1 MAG: hypothetical protein A2236_01015 [Bacteroidetes bacterium RIFOXYA2_FULL_33_7]HBF87335.1 hypothetical protein [Bacteroidales bacterium]
MKAIFSKKFIFIFSFISIFAATSIYSQNPTRVEEVKESKCMRKDFCSEDFGEYDYRSQSSYGEFSPGDTVRAKFIVYSGQDYRLFACGHPDLGDIQFKIIEPIKKTNRVIKDIQKQEVVEYDLDEWGDAKVDENGEMIVKRKYTKKDTIWARETVISEKIIFDSMNNKTSQLFWEASVVKTRRLIIEVLIPEGDKSIYDCVNIYIGRMQTRNKKFFQY